MTGRAEPKPPSSARSPICSSPDRTASAPSTSRPRPREYVPRVAGTCRPRRAGGIGRTVERGRPALSRRWTKRFCTAAPSAEPGRRRCSATASAKLIAKFSSTTDTYPVVKGEFLAMELARRAGLEAAPVRADHGARPRCSAGRALRPARGGGRRAMVSALTMLGARRARRRYASYADLADLVRARFTDPAGPCGSCSPGSSSTSSCGNNDDHARNHAAFWDGADAHPHPRLRHLPAAAQRR